jgi:hypothetical protein
MRQGIHLGSGFWKEDGPISLPSFITDTNYVPLEFLREANYWVVTWNFFPLKLKSLESSLISTLCFGEIWCRPAVPPHLTSPSTL